MNKLHVIDDDERKCALATSVMGALRTINDSWELGINKTCSNKQGNESIIQVMGNPGDGLLLVDVEIIYKDAAVRKAIVGQLSHLLGVPTCPVGNDILKRYQTVFGNEEKYRVASLIMACAERLQIPAMLISTKRHETKKVAFESAARTAGIPVIEAWLEDHSDWDAATKATICTNIARSIDEYWKSVKGRIEHRLWPAEALEGNGWFNDDSEHPHPVVEHDLKARSEGYDAVIRNYLHRIINPGKCTPVNFASYAPSVQLHKALKRFVGICARVHGPRESERLPDMNVIVLLAAAWDPGAASWFSKFQWNATHPLMKDDATKIELRTAILALGGEKGLFSKLFIKEKFQRKTPGKPSYSSVTDVSVKPNVVEFKLNVCVKTLAERFNAGKSGKAVKGGTSNALLSAWLSLETKNGRTVNIEVKDNTVTLKKNP